MQKIIFLDIDGVLNSYHGMYSPIKKLMPKKIKKSPTHMICRDNLFWVSLLCRITGATVVLSSSWRYFWDENGKIKEEADCKRHGKVDELFRKYGINIFSKTGGIVRNPKEHEFNQENLKNYLDKRSELQMFDLDNNRIIINKDFVVRGARGSQILEWLDKNNYKDNYVILEDDWLGIVIYKELEDHLVKTSFYKRLGGFRFKHLIKAIKILNRK